MSFLRNHKYDKKTRYRTAEALIKPIMTYGIVAMNPNEKNDGRIDTEMNKIYRMIDEAEMKGQKESEKIRKTNIQIKKQNNIRTIESQLEKERCSFALNGRKTKSAAYMYDRNKNEYNIEKAIKTLKEIKKTITEGQDEIDGKK